MRWYYALMVIAFVASLYLCCNSAGAAPDPNACLPSGACSAIDFQISCVASTSKFPACNSARNGQQRCAVHTAYWCDSSNWIAYASVGNGGPYVKTAGDTMSGGLSTPDIDAGRVESSLAAGNDWLFLNKSRIVYANGDMADGGTTKCRSNGSVLICTEGGAAPVTISSNSSITHQWTANTIRFTDNLHVADNANFVYLDSDHALGLKVGITTANSVAENREGLYVYPLNAGTADAGIFGVRSSAFYPVFAVTNLGSVNGNQFCPYDGGACWDGSHVGTFGGYCITGGGTGGCEAGEAATTSPFLGGFSPARTGVIPKVITCSYGTKTATSGTIQPEVIDLTAGLTHCYCTTPFNCTVAINTPTACACDIIDGGTGQYTVGHVYALGFRQAGTTCDANPNNVFCNHTYQ